MHAPCGLNQSFVQGLASSSAQLNDSAPGLLLLLLLQRNLQRPAGCALICRAACRAQTEGQCF